MMRSREVAAYLGCLPDSVRNLVHRGLLVPADRDAQGLLFDPAQVAAFAASGVYRPTPRRRDGVLQDLVWETLAALRRADEPLTAAELAVALDRDPGNVRKYLAVLRAKGLVERIGDTAEHVVTAAGQSFRPDNSEQCAS